MPSASEPRNKTYAAATSHRSGPKFAKHGLTQFPASSVTFCKPVTAGDIFWSGTNSYKIPCWNYSCAGASDGTGRENKMRQPAFAASCSLLLCLLPVRAWAGVFNLIIENDAFSGTDYYYTNGILLDYVSDRHNVAPALENVIYSLPNIDPDDNIYTGVHLGQQIFTPSNLHSTELLENDRPYAGYLFGGISLVASNYRQLQHWRLSVGVVGPRSRAEKFQHSIHDRLGVSEPKGWEHQIDNENILQFLYQYSWRQAWHFNGGGMGRDIIPSVGVALGNAGVHADAGLTFRYGRGFGGDFGPPRMQPGIAGSDYFRPGRNSWYLFAGFGARYVIRNIFLDGNTHLESHSVDKKDWVGDVQLGFVINGESYRLAYTFTTRSPEFHGQDGAHSFGSVALSFHF